MENYTKNSIKEYTIDKSKVLSDYMNTKITAERCKEIHEKAEIERARMIRQFGYNESFANEHIRKRATEIAYTSSSYREFVDANYSEYTDYEKAMLASNIALDKNMVASILSVSHNPLFSFDNLVNYIATAGNFDFIARRTGHKTSKEVYDKFLEKYNTLIMDTFSKYFGEVQPHLIINMINEIISYEPELLDSYRDSRHFKNRSYV